MKRLIISVLSVFIVATKLLAFDFSASCGSGQTLYYIITSNSEPYTVSITYPQYSSANFYYGYTKPSGNLVIPATVTYNEIEYAVTIINDNAFRGCSGLTSVTIPNSVTGIANLAFYGCSGLTSVTVPNSVTSIGQYAFSGCSGLTSITLPFVGDKSHTSSDTYQYPFGYIFGTSSYTGGTETTQYYYGSSTSSTTGSTYYVPTSLKEVVITGSSYIPYGAFYNCSGLTSITIPNSVTSIGNYAFYGCSGLTSVTIPNSVTSIGSSAFSGCTKLQYNEYDNAYYLGSSSNLYLVLVMAKSTDIAWCSISENTKIISSNAFRSCSVLTSIEIPEGVTSIGYGAFYYCSNLSYVDLPNTLTTIDDGAFGSCSKLASITIPNSVTSIGGGIFQNCSVLESVVIGNAVESIGNYAFNNCTKLLSVNIPASVTTIGENAFKGATKAVICCKATSKPDGWDGDWNNNGGTVVWNGIVYNGWAYVVTSANEPRTVSAYKYLGSATSITIPETVISDGVEYQVTGIYQNAFKDNTGLTSVSIPNSITAIGANAFSGCTGLTSVTIPNTVQSLGNSAFSGCTGLKSVTIGSGLSSISEGAFYNCTGLTSIEIPSTITTLGGNAFRGCTGLTQIEIPNSVTKLGSSAFYDCSGLQLVVVPQSVTTAGTEVFRGCTSALICCKAASKPGGWNDNWNNNGGTAVWGGLVVGDWVYQITSANAPRSVMVCKYTGSATSITIPSKVSADGLEYSVTGISDDLFKNNYAITSVTIPNTILTIGNYAFSNCSGLTSITANSVTSIGQYAFNGCSGLVQASLGSSVETIGDKAFYNCTSLTSVVLSNTISSIGQYAFYNCNGIKSLVIPDALTTISSYAFANCSGLTSVEFGNSVTSIGQYAFSYCSRLTAIIIPNTVTNIEGYAFNNCSGLKYAAIPNSVTSMGEKVFYNCSNVVYCQPASRPNGWDSNWNQYGNKNYLSVVWGIIMRDGVAYQITSSAESNAVSVYKYLGDEADVVIPEKIESNGIEYAVTSIYAYAFKGCSGLTSVTIPYSVTSIGSSAFEGCTGLTSVAIPNSVTSIGSNAFSGCSGLTLVTIPNSVTTIGMAAFGNSNIVFCCEPASRPTGWNWNSSYNAQDWNYNRGTIYWGTVVQGDYILKITNSAEPYTASICKYIGNDDNVSIPDKTTINGIEYAVTKISSYAFMGKTNIKSVVVPNSVLEMETGVFSGCSSLETLTLPFVGDKEHAKNSNDAQYPFGYIFGTSSYDGSLETDQCYVKKDETTGIHTNYYIPAKLKNVIVTNTERLPFYAFGNCTNIENIQILSNLKSTDNSVFNHCSGLKRLNSDIDGVFNIPEGIDFISNFTFAYCDNMQIVTIPDTITKIGKYAFQNCVNLVSANIPNSVVEINEGAFYHCGKLSSISLPNTVQTIGMHAFGFCTGLSSISLPESVTIIDDYVFNDCSNMKSISIPNTVYYIGEGAFMNSGLTTITLPNSVKLINAGAFMECADLKSLILPNSVDSIGNYAFNECVNLTSVSIPASVVYLGNGVFSDCWALTSVSVPSTVTTMGELVFTNCTDATIYCMPTIKPAGWNTDWNKDGGTVIWGANVVEATVSAQANNISFGSVEGIGKYMISQKATLTAVPSTGCKFVSWNDGSTDNPRVITVAGDTTLTANFDVVYTYSVASTVPQKGSVSCEVNCYSDGISLLILATPNHGYHFTSWEDGETTNPRIITLTQDTSILAQFDVNQYNISVKTNLENCCEVTGDGLHNYNTTNIISVKAKDDFVFVRWSDGSTSDSRKVLLLNDTTLTAIFAKTYNYLSIKANNDEYGNVEGSGLIKYNTVATMKAVAAEHYHFVSWSDSVIQNPRQIIVLSDTMFTANFAIDTFSVAELPNNQLGYVSGTGQYAYGSIVTVEAVPNPHHHFIKWKNNNSTQEKQTFTLHADTTLSPIFAIDTHRIEVTCNKLLGAVEGTGIFTYGSKVVLTAQNVAGCYFVRWSDNVTSNPRVLNVSSDSTIEAIFSEMPMFTVSLTSSDAAMGIVSGDGTYPMRESVTITATPNEHCRFVQWNDGRADNPRTFKIFADASYVAVFEQEQYNVIVTQNDVNMGTVSGGGTFAYLDVAECVAASYQGSHFVKWSNDATDNPYRFSVTDDLILTAIFESDYIENPTSINSERQEQVRIYAHGNTIVVENATDEIRIYNAMGQLVCRDAMNRVRAEINVSGTGIYIVRTGAVAKRVMVND